ncbi:hypothetical protein GGR55DRAFT_395197 [Xylaria sp. FL0064]|nr:hypothetical protein GGR55DRAFT_395197 [Xylaria sp. FL0064]
MYEKTRNGISGRTLSKYSAWHCHLFTTYGILAMLRLPHAKLSNYHLRLKTCRIGITAYMTQANLGSAGVAPIQLLGLTHATYVAIVGFANLRQVTCQTLGLGLSIVALGWLN